MPQALSPGLLHGRSNSRRLKEEIGSSRRWSGVRGADRGARSARQGPGRVIIAGEMIESKCNEVYGL